MPKAEKLETDEDTRTPQEALREQAKAMLAEALQMDNDAAVAASIASRKATPGRMTANEHSTIIQAQIDKRRERDNKRRRDAMDAPTVNMQALDIIRKRNEPSTVKDSGSVPTGDTNDSNTAPNVPSSAEGSPPPAVAGSAGRAGKNANVLQQGANGVESGTDPVKPGPDGGGGKNSSKRNGGKRVSIEPFLQ